MHRAGWTALATLVSVSSPAAADETLLGAYFGPRIYSTDSRLGYIEDAPAHPSLENSMQLGVRVGRPFLPWLVPELELSFSPTDTTAAGGAAPASVLWMEPRLHIRFEILPGRRIQPFVLVGGGGPIVFSSARQTLNTGITGEAYVGAGVRFDSGRSFGIRLDARVSALPGIERYFTPEVDISLGIELTLGGGRRRLGSEHGPGGPIADRDGDGIPDAQDRCPDRDEDKDGFDDTDGCPDIDNDLDRVLDIADRCASEPETYNGFEDEDGCPDTVPQEIDALRGTIEGLIYADGETAVRDSAMPNLTRIATTLAAQPSIRILLVGHTDDREALQFATPVEGGEPPDIATIAADLARARAEAVRQALVSVGVAQARIEILGSGAEDPVADNGSAKGRLANRRVELRLFVPTR